MDLDELYNYLDNAIMREEQRDELYNLGKAMLRDELYNLGNAMMREKQYDEALGFYSRALDVDPTFGLAYYNRGLCRFYLKDEGGLEDLIQAARLNCEFAPLYETLCRYGIFIHGFEAIAKLITNEDLPANAKEHLSRELCTKLSHAHHLLNSRKLEENQPDEGTLIRFCQIADAATPRERQQTSTKQCLLLRHVLAEAQHTSDTEVEWRAWYLLGVMAYYPIAIRRLPPHLPHEIPDVFGPLSWSDKKTASVLIELAKEKNVELLDESELVRMASVARYCFHHASSVLCAQSVEPQLLKREDMEKAWCICENVFRELGRCCVFLDSTKGLIDAIERARFCYHMNWAHSLRATAEKLDRGGINNGSETTTLKCLFYHRQRVKRKVAQVVKGSYCQMTAMAYLFSHWIE